MGVKITNDCQTWTSEQDMKLIDGLITVFEVKHAKTLKVGEDYQVFEVPDNGREFGSQKLTKKEGRTVTFSKPPRR